MRPIKTRTDLIDIVTPFMSHLVDVRKTINDTIEMLNYEMSEMNSARLYMVQEKEMHHMAAAKNLKNGDKMAARFSLVKESKIKDKIELHDFNYKQRCEELDWLNNIESLLEESYDKFDSEFEILRNAPSCEITEDVMSDSITACLELLEKELASGALSFGSGEKQVEEK